MPPSRRWALALCLLSFTGWSSWELLRPARSPFMDLAGIFTDHFSHMNAGRLFTRFGLDVWRQPLTQLLPRATPAEEALLPEDERACHDCIFLAPGWSRPVLQSWPHVVRFYPPGDMLLTAPLAALYHFTSIPATAVNRMLLVLLLACAHLGLLVLLEDLFAAPEGLRWHTLLPGFLGALAVLHWTLEGFYDCSMVAPLLLCWRYLGQRRGLAAGVAFCAAAFLHFRAFYYAPWALAAGLLVLRERQWRSWTRRDWLAAGAAALMGAASLGSYFLALPGMIAFPDYLSPLLITRSHLDRSALLTAALIAGVALTAFVAARSWLDVLMVPWLALVLTTVRQTMPWYMIAIVPWLCSVPRPGRPERAPLVLDGRVLIFLFLAVAVHADHRIGLDVVPEWLARRFY
jgi:hypothetical protein